MDTSAVSVATPVEVVKGLLASGVGVAASTALCLSYYGACAGVRGIEWASGFVDGEVREVLKPYSAAVCSGEPPSACLPDSARATVDELVESLQQVSVDTVAKGKHWAANRRKKEARKRRSRAGNADCGTSLQSSLEAKWEAENKLAVKQAERKLALLEARDLESEKKMQRAQIMRTTEAAKVQTERAYATLKRTGNVPGFAETVVTDGSLSPDRSDGTCISPDSSVSQQEIRAMMKELEDYKLTLSRIERDNPALVAHHMEGHGVKTAFTLDSDGMCPVDEPGCMGIDGKYHLDSYERNPKFYKDRFRAEEATERYFNRE